MNGIGTHNFGFTGGFVGLAVWADSVMGMTSPAKHGMRRQKREREAQNDVARIDP